MYRAVLRVVATAALILGGLFAWQHFRQAPAPPVAEEPKTETDTQTLEDKMAREVVAIRGPLADYMRSNKSAPEQEMQSAGRTPSQADRIKDSPVGTSLDVLHKKFVVRRVAHVRFEIPPHALTPRFCGTFRSLVGGEASHDASANVDFLLMNEEQYAGFAAGRDQGALYVADTTHFRDISVDLSPSRDQPVSYYLVFRNSPAGADVKTVQADFRVDF
ncbi:MAG TPA: hypothetical protein VGG14_13580 [Candidatus Sulfotelmatobacter sp.]